MLSRNSAASAPAILGIGPAMNTRNVNTSPGSHDDDASAKIAGAAFGDHLRSNGHGGNGCDIRNAMSIQNCDERNGEKLRISQNWGMDSPWLKKLFSDHPEKSQAALARELGVDPSAVTRILKGERQIKAYEVPRITKFFTGEEQGTDGRPSLYSALPSFRGISSSETVPVMGVAEGGRDGMLDWSSEVIDNVPRPPLLGGAVNAYALYVTGSSMEPRYQHGELLYVNPAKPVTVHSFVVVQFQRAEESNIQAVVKQFVKRTISGVILRQLNPEKTLTIPSEQVRAMHRIVGSGEA